MGLNAEHVCGHTYHGRHGAIKNAFRYRFDYVLSDLAQAQKTPALFSRNRANVTSLHDKDHGGAPGKGSGLDWVHGVLRDHGFGQFCDSEILLLAQPRVWGHVFNPVSFWLVFDDAKVLRLVIAEVSNTYGDRHSYLCHHDDLRPIAASDRIVARKIFHVSPFQPVEGTYTFRFDVTDDHIGVVIDYRSDTGGVYATFHGRRQTLTNRSILVSAIARPLGSLRVLALIHWQALRLWSKGALFRARPEVPDTEVSS